jgi:hypothetical protein
VVTESPWLLWLELELSLLEPSLLWVEPESSLLELSLLWVESSLLCVEVVPVSLWLDVPEDDALVAVVLVAPPFPRAATASHAATNVASVAAAMRRRTVRRRCLMGASGGCGMRRIVAAFAQILLGTSYGAGKNRLAAGYGASNVT